MAKNMDLNRTPGSGFEEKMRTHLSAIGNGFLRQCSFLSSLSLKLAKNKGFSSFECLANRVLRPLSPRSRTLRYVYSLCGCRGLFGNLCPFTVATKGGRLHRRD